MHAKTQVWSTRTERNVWVGVASDVECIGIDKDVFIAIRRAVEHHHTLAGFDVLSANSGVFHDGSLEV